MKVNITSNPIFKKESFENLYIKWCNRFKEIPTDLSDKSTIEARWEKLDELIVENGWSESEFMSVKESKMSTKEGMREILLLEFRKKKNKI